MSATLGALAPVFLLIIAGALLRRRRWLGDGFWPGAESLTYYGLFPCLVIHELAGAQLAGGAALAAGAAMTGAIVLVALTLSLLRPVLGFADTAYTSVFQGAIRPNTYVGFAAAGVLLGPSGLVLMTVGLACAVPVINILCVVVLNRYGGTPAPAGSRLRGAVVGLACNPILVGIAVGLVLNATAIGRPPILGEVMAICGRAALPLGLLAVGASLDIGAARRAGYGLLLASTIKLLLLPLVTLALARLIGLGPAEGAAAVLFNGLPVASSSYILAVRMGGDHRLMAGTITASTLLAAATLPFLLALA